MALPTLLTTDLRRRSGVGDGPPPVGSGGSGDEYWDYTNLRLYLHDGGGWIILSEPEQTYTPGVTSINVNNGTLTGRYHRSDGWCDFAAALNFGTTTAITAASCAINAPIAAGGLLGLNGASLGVELYHAASGINPAIAYTNGATAVVPFTISPYGFVSATNPWTWANGDAIWIQGRYRMVSRYS